MEKLRNVKMQQIDKECDKCKNGYMRPNGLIKPTIPPHFGHMCTSCGFEQYYGIRYPVTI